MADIHITSPIPGGKTAHKWINIVAARRDKNNTVVRELFSEALPGVASADFGGYHLAVVMAALHGPANYEGLIKVINKVVASTDEGRVAFIRRFHDVWTGVQTEYNDMSPELFGKCHNAARALWAEWVTSPEGAHAAARLSSKSSSAMDEIFGGTLASGKAKAAGAGAAMSSEQKQLKAAERAVDAANARLDEIRARAK